MRRRELIAALGSAAIFGPVAAGAEQKIARVGIIDDAPVWDVFRQQLRELNYIEGQSIAFDYRTAQGIPDRLRQAAEELSRIPVDVIAVFGTPAAQAAKRATTRIPVVAISIGDPIGAGLIANFARPGGNVTGNTILGPDVVTKRLQILKDGIPNVSRVAFLWNPDNASNNAIWEQLRKAVPLFHMTLLPVKARVESDFVQVFDQLSADAPDALLTTNDPLHQTQMKEVIAFLLRKRLQGCFRSNGTSSTAG